MKLINKFERFLLYSVNNYEWRILRKIIRKLENREVKKALASSDIF